MTISDDLKAHPEKHGCPYKIGQEFKKQNGAVYKVEQIDAATAHAVSKIGGNIIATVAVEIQAAAIIGAENLQSLNGLTPEERRVVAGGVVHRLK